MINFVELGEYGLLKMDRILFEAAYPILFTCRNDRNELFICVCCQNNENGKKWLVSKTTPARLIHMLKDEITIREVFLDDASCRASISSNGGAYNIYFDVWEDWAEDSIFLPKKGEYIEAEPDEFKDDIEYYTLKSKSIAWNDFEYSSILQKDYSRIMYYYIYLKMHVEQIHENRNISFNRDYSLCNQFAYSEVVKKGDSEQGMTLSEIRLSGEDSDYFIAA